eukprot:c41982_g1_i1 orf=330-515(+)
MASFFEPSHACKDSLLTPLLLKTPPRMLQLQIKVVSRLESFIGKTASKVFLRDPHKRLHSQ